MDSTLNFLQEMIQLYSIALLGFLVRKFGIFNENTNHVLTQLILYITLPALILYSLNMPFSYHLMKDFLWLIAMSSYALLLSIFLAIWMRNRSQLNENQKSVYEGLIIFGNQGYIGFAVIFAIFGEQGIVYLTMYNIVLFILIWTYGIYLFSRSKATINWSKVFLNPGTFSTFVGLIILFLPISMPSGIANTLESLGKMTVPLSMILIGSLIADVKYNDFPLLLKNKYIWKAALAKLLIVPLLLLPFAFLSVPLPLLTIAVLVAGMPSAPTISIYAQEYNGDTLFASIGVIVSSLLCVITIPFLYFILSL
ncbi:MULTISPECIES: AEC family transporter [Oceanobacillus]|uniref:AEC family transporter n=1 Tax=Oceanobacillus profundus TaxID=372463 RepID=A0A417YAK8_9BACI|nr:AEC family transporter [Oceanobacillus profundus]MBR3118854.1 AEC family transporter [Oceanobacillus sp.]MCM3398313.1 AEC family transporter [Oceanobacillus profundus]PAE30797.1 auxin efflux carrier [Paenibacillus sp. 7884-2]RHW29591.1 AEC family transporter [Oceanobacillus profundus]